MGVKQHEYTLRSKRPTSITLRFSLAGALVGVGAFALLRARTANPVPLFLRIAAVVLLVSFAAPGTAFLQGIILNLLHAVVAAAVVWSVVRTQRA